MSSAAASFVIPSLSSSTRSKKTREMPIALKESNAADVIVDLVESSNIKDIPMHGNIDHDIITAIGHSGETTFWSEEERQEPDLISETDEDEVGDDIHIEDHFKYEGQYQQTHKPPQGNDKFTTLNESNDAVEIDYTDERSQAQMELTVAIEEVNNSYDVTSDDELEIPPQQEEQHPSESSTPPPSSPGSSPGSLNTTILIQKVRSNGSKETSMDPLAMATNSLTATKTHSWFRGKPYGLRRTNRINKQKQQNNKTNEDSSNSKNISSNNSSSNNNISYIDYSKSYNTSLLSEDESEDSTISPDIAAEKSNNALQLGSSIRNAYKVVQERKMRIRQKKLDDDNKKSHTITNTKGETSTPRTVSTITSTTTPASSNDATGGGGGWFSRLGLTAKNHKNLKMQQDKYLKALVSKAFHETGTTKLLRKEGGPRALNDLDLFLVLAEAVQAHRNRYGETNATNAKDLQGPFHKAVVEVCVKHLSIRSCRLAGIGLLENDDGSVSVDPVDDTVIPPPSTLSSSTHSKNNTESDRIGMRSIRSTSSIKNCDPLRVFEEPAEQERRTRWKNTFSEHDPRDVETLKKDLKTIIQLLVPPQQKKGISLHNKDKSLFDDQTLSTTSDSSRSSMDESFEWWDDYVETEFDRFVEEPSFDQRVNQLCIAPKAVCFDNHTTDKMHLMCKGNGTREDTTGQGYDWSDANRMPECGAHISDKEKEEENDDGIEQLQQQERNPSRCSVLECIYEEPNIYEEIEPIEEEISTPVIAENNVNIAESSSNAKTPTAYHMEKQQQSGFNWFQCIYPSSGDSIASEEITKPLESPVIKTRDDNFPPVSTVELSDLRMKNSRSNSLNKSVPAQNISWGANDVHEYQDDDEVSEEEFDEHNEQDDDISGPENLTFDSVHEFTFDDDEPNLGVDTSDLSPVAVDPEEAAENQYFDSCMSNAHASFESDMTPQDASEPCIPSTPIRKIGSLLESIVQDTSDNLAPFIDDSPCRNEFWSGENDVDIPDEPTTIATVSKPTKTVAVSKLPPNTMRADEESKSRKKKSLLKRIFRRKSKQTSKTNFDSKSLPHARSSLNTSISLPHLRAELPRTRKNTSPPVIPEDFTCSEKTEKRQNSKVPNLQPKNNIYVNQRAVASERSLEQRSRIGNAYYDQKVKSIASQDEPPKVSKLHLFGRRSRLNLKPRSDSNSLSMSLPHSVKRGTQDESLKESKLQRFGRRSRSNPKPRSDTKSLSISLPHSAHRETQDQSSTESNLHRFGRGLRSNSKPRSDVNSLSISLSHSTHRETQPESLTETRLHLFGTRPRSSPKPRSDPNSLSISLPHSTHREPQNKSLKESKCHLVGRKSKTDAKPKSESTSLSSSLPHGIRHALTSNSLPHVRNKLSDASERSVKSVLPKSRKYEKLDEPSAAKSQFTSLSNSLPRRIQRGLTSNSLPHMRSVLSGAPEGIFSSQLYDKLDDSASQLELDECLSFSQFGEEKKEDDAFCKPELDDSVRQFEGKRNFKQKKLSPGRPFDEVILDEVRHQDSIKPFSSEFNFQPSFPTQQSANADSNYLPSTLSNPVEEKLLPPAEELESPPRVIKPRIVSPELNTFSPVSFDISTPKKMDSRSRMVSPEPLDLKFSKSQSLETPPLQKINTEATNENSGNNEVLFSGDPFSGLDYPISPSSTMSTRIVTNVSKNYQPVESEQKATFQDNKNETKNVDIESEEASTGSEIDSYLPLQTRRGLRITVSDSRSSDMSSSSSTFILPHYYGEEEEAQDNAGTAAKEERHCSGEGKQKPTNNKHASNSISGVSGNESLLDDDSGLFSATGISSDGFPEVDHPITGEQKESIKDMETPLPSSSTTDYFDSFPVLSSKESNITKCANWDLFLKPFPPTPEREKSISNRKRISKNDKHSAADYEDDDSFPVLSFSVPTDFPESESVSSRSALTTFSISTNGTESNKPTSSLDILYPKTLGYDENSIENDEQNNQTAGSSAYLKKYDVSTYTHFSALTAEQNSAARHVSPTRYEMESTPIKTGTKTSSSNGKQQTSKSRKNKGTTRRNRDPPPGKYEF